MKLVFVLAAGLVMASCNNPTKEASSAEDSTNKMATSTGDKDADKKQRNIETAKELLHAINEHNPDAAFKDADPGFVDYGDGSMDAVRGVDSAKKMVKVFFQSMPDFKGEDFTFVVAENKVAVVGDWSGTFKNDMMGMKATGKSFKFKDVDVFTFNDEGKITEHRSIYPLGYALSGAGNKK